MVYTSIVKVQTMLNSTQNSFDYHKPNPITNGNVLLSKWRRCVEDETSPILPIHFAPAAAAAAGVGGTEHNKQRGDRQWRENSILSDEIHVAQRKIAENKLTFIYFISIFKRNWPEQYILCHCEFHLFLRQKNRCFRKTITTTTHSSQSSLRNRTTTPIISIQ